MYPGLLETILLIYEERTQSQLESLDTFVYQFARTIVKATKTGSPCTAFLSNSEGSDYRLIVQPTGNTLRVGVVIGKLVEWHQTNRREENEGQ